MVFVKYCDFFTKQGGLATVYHHLHNQASVVTTCSKSYIVIKYIDNNVSIQVLVLNISKIPSQRPFKIAINFQTNLKKSLEYLLNICVL